MRRLLPIAALLLLAGCMSYHPRDFEVAEVHGEQLRLGLDDCTACHGDALDGTGSSSVSCDGCHPIGWREDCTFCHGGTSGDESGAPPRDLDRTQSEADTVFPPHRVHTDETMHGAYRCTMCHVTPDDVTSDGHVFDATPGRAEVDFSGGIAPDASWGGEGCSNNYCHGDGQENGDIDVTESNLRCDSCHAPPNVSGSGAAALSGEHREHIRHDIECAECHPNVDTAGRITIPVLHVDGEASINLGPDISWANGTCSGNCHNEQHDDRDWD